MPAAVRTLREDLLRCLEPGPVGRGLPRAWYTDPSLAAIEAGALFRGRWVCVASLAEIGPPGSLFPVVSAGLPILLVRDPAGGLRAFHNVCPHRGMLLAAAPARLRGPIRCPYHSWAYDLEGRLRATPHVGGVGIDMVEGLCAADVRLAPVAAAVWMGLVFIDIDGAAGPFERFIAPLAARWAAFADIGMAHAASLRFAPACDWKLAVENYCEAYHLPWVHPGLERYSPLAEHEPLLGEGFAGQVSLSYRPAPPPGAPALPPFAGLGEGAAAHWSGRGEYAALFPNLLLGLHADHLFAMRVEPDGTGRCIENVDLFVAPSAMGPEHAPARAALADGWRAVFDEDVAVVEGMQKGRVSPAFDGGLITPVMEEPTRAFHRWAACALAEALPAAATSPAMSVAV
jgi:choline monooxygenase